MYRSFLLSAAAFAIAPSLAQAEAIATSDEVVVTATRTERRLQDVPESVSVVTARTIENTPAQSLDQVLRRVPSVDVANIDAPQVHPTSNFVSMRGLGGIRALVLLDGVPLNDPFFGYLQWSRVPLENVERVEIVRGGGSALWGNYAMGGVINILTRAPTENELVLQGGAGSYGTYRSNAFGALADDRGALSLSVGRNHTDGFMQIEPADRGPIDVPTTSTTDTAALRGDLDLTESLKAGVRLDYFDNSQNLQTRLSSNSQKTWNYAGTLTQTFSPNDDLALVLFGTDSKFKTFNTGGFDGVPENEAEFTQNVHRTPVTDFGASLVWTHTESEGLLRSLSLGTDFHRVSGADVADIFDETDTFVRTDVGRGKQRLMGAFAQASLRPIEAVEVLGSVRYQSFKNYDAFDGNPGGLGDLPASDETSVDPRVSVRWQTSEHFALRAAAYTAFRAPALDNLYRAFSIPFGVFLPNAALKPESLDGYEAGFDFTTGNVRFQATAYHSTIDDIITSRNLAFSELPPGFFFGSKNINAGEAVSKGVEAELDWVISDRLSAQAAYTYADSQITKSAEDPLSVGNQIGGVAKNRASASVTYTAPQGWSVTPEVRWIEKSFADNDNTLPVDSQFVADLSMRYPFSDKFEMYLNIENLFDAHYIADNSGFNPPLRGTPFSAFLGARVKLH